MSFQDAVQALSDPDAIEYFDESHSTKDEDRFICIGATTRFVMLMVVFTDRKGTTMIISARHADSQERKLYAKRLREKIAEIEKNAIPDCEIDYSDAPKLSAEQLSQFEARYSVNRDLYKPLKKATTIRLDADCLDYLKHSGAGWQTRVNDFIRKGIASGQL